MNSAQTGIVNFDRFDQQCIAQSYADLTPVRHIRTNVASTLYSAQSSIGNSIHLFDLDAEQSDYASAMMSIDEFVSALVDDAPREGIASLARKRLTV